MIGTPGEKMARFVESVEVRVRCALYMGPFFRVAKRPLERLRYSSCALAPLKNPPQG